MDLANHAAHTYLLINDGLRDSLPSVVRQHGGKHAFVEKSSAELIGRFQAPYVLQYASCLELCFDKNNDNIIVII